MVLEMLPKDPAVTVRDALSHLVSYIAETRDLTIELPWQASDEVLCTLFIKALLESGIVEPTPLS